MRRTICILSILLLVTLSNNMVGQTYKVKGTYQGKPIVIEYQEGASGKDYVSSITYKPFDDLQAEKKKLENDKAKSEKRVKELTEEVDRLRRKGPSGDELARLQTELKNAQNQLSQTNASLAQKENDIARLSSDIQHWQEELKSAQDRLAIAEKLASDYAEEIERLKGLKLDNKDYLSIRAHLSSSTMYNDLTKQNFWIQEASLGQSYQLTYTKYFSSNSSAAITIGVGLERYKFSANIPFMEEYHAGLTDPDGDEMDMGLQYNSITENVSLTYLNVPIELHIGNNTKGRGCQPWVDAGFLLSINTGSTFEGTGKYSNYGYYPQWDLRVSDEPLLGLTNSADAYSGETQWGLNGIVLWGILGVGVNVPISDSHWAINAGARCAYSLTAVSKEMESDGVADTQYRLGVSNLLGGEGTRIFNWGISLGISYSLEPVKIYDIPNEQ